jgi:hypothetical protein
MQSTSAPTMMRNQVTAIQKDALLSAHTSAGVLFPFPELRALSHAQWHRRRDWMDGGAAQEPRCCIVQGLSRSSWLANFDNKVHLVLEQDLEQDQGMGNWDGPLEDA